MCSFEWRSYTLKCTRSFLNISQFSLNNKQWSDQNSVLYFYIFNGRETLHALFSIMVNSGHGHTDCCCRDHRCLSSPPHAGCLLRPCFFVVKKQQPPFCLIFSCPFCHLLSSHTSQQEPAALPSYRHSLPVCLRNELYSHVHYFLRRWLSQHCVCFPAGS